VLHNKAAQFENDNGSLRLSKDSLYSSFFSNKRLTQPGKLGGGGLGTNLHRNESTDSIHNVFGMSNFQFGANKAGGINNGNSDILSNKSLQPSSIKGNKGGGGLLVPRFGGNINNGK
jgi:hypothetical protein